MEKILVVDDEKSILTMCSKLLKRENYQAYVTESADDALKLIPVEMFDLVVTDLNLEGKNGIELIKIIKSSYPATQIIVMTGRSTVEIAVESLKSGAYDFLPKPFSPAQFISSVKKALEYSSLKRNESVFREIMSLYKISKEMPAAQTEIELTNYMLERVASALVADCGAIYLYDDNKKKFMEINTTLLIDPELQAKVIVDKKPLLSQGSKIDPSVISLMIAPLVSQEHLLGYISLGRNKNITNYQFSPHDLESFENFAMHAALMLSALRHNLALKELERLKSDFLANVSHELRTPLMSINGAFELLLDEKGISKEEQMPDVIFRNIQRMTYLVHDLLSFSRLEKNEIKLEITEFSIKTLLDESLEDYKLKAIENKIDLTFENKEKAPDTIISADREKIKQVIVNLIGNSIKFTHESGWVKVTLEEQSGNVLITFSDSGIGIPIEKQQFVFDKFYQVDSSSSRVQQGFGLGLAIVKSIVLVHNGKVWLESEPNKGTKVFVSLPIKYEK